MENSRMQALYRTPWFAALFVAVVGGICFGLAGSMAFVLVAHDSGSISIQLLRNYAGAWLLGGLVFGAALWAYFSYVFPSPFRRNRSSG
jgi:hypothetical protein